MTDKERKILEDAGLLYPVPNCVEYYQTVQEIAKEVADSIWEAINNKVQVVRCKDCKWCKPINSEVRGFYKNCMRHEIAVYDDGFCAWGERREDGEVD